MSGRYHRRLDTRHGRITRGGHPIGGCAGRHAVLYQILASVTVLLHASFVIFVLLGGLALHRYTWVVWLHVPAVGYGILIQSIGWRCPLTDLEKWFRSLAGQPPYADEFLPHYVWSPLGLTGTEPMVLVGFLAILVAVNWRPYVAWATA